MIFTAIFFNAEVFLTITCCWLSEQENAYWNLSTQNSDLSLAVICLQSSKLYNLQEES